MLILADGADVRDLVPADERIRYLYLDGATGIGEKRNFGCSQAGGEIVAHWDDDDWSESGRLEDQVQRLVSSGMAVTGYHSMRFTDGQRWWKYEGTPDYIIGTSLCYWKSWWEAHRFPALQVGEDNAFRTEAFEARKLIAVDAGDRMYATNHPGNTSPRRLSSNWKAL